MIKNKLAIIVGKDGRPSMKGVYSKMENDSQLLIRRRLETKHGINEYWRSYANHNVNDFTKLLNISLNDQIVVRWGNCIEIPLNNCIIYNMSSAIARATNKKLSREMFIEKGLNCPKLITSQKDINQNTSFPIIARPIKHSKGKNFILLKSIHEYNAHVNTHNDWYYSEFVDKTNEYRLHIAHGRVLNYLEKPKPNDNQIAWNRALNEDPFVNVKWNDYNGKICSLAIRALKALALDFGAVDIMLDKEGNACLLEVNTAGTLVSSEYSMQRYAMYFDWLCKTNKRREHWEFKEFKKSSNYAWHEFHFEDREPNKEV